MAACIRTVGTGLCQSTVSAASSPCTTSVEYVRPGQSLEPREGKALVFSRIRFFYDAVLDV
jgi:hypothetical protein